MDRTLDMNYDEIVVGADLSAIIYCYANKVPLIFTRRLSPYKNGLDENYEKDIKEWEHKFYALCINNLCPLANLVQTIRLEDDILKVATKDNFLVNIKFNKLILSDDHKVEGLPEPVYKTSNDNCVIDYMGIFEYIPIIPVKQIGVRVPEIIRHKREYIERGRHHRQLYVTSRMTDEELKQMEFSESYMRFRIKKHFDEPDKIRLVHISREVHKLGKNVYDLKNVKMLIDDIEDLRKLEIKQDKNFQFLERELCFRQKKRVLQIEESLQKDPQTHISQESFQ